MQFYFSHLMPWPHLPEDFDTRYDSAWVDLPNSLYDPERGHQVYNEYLDELVAAVLLALGYHRHDRGAWRLRRDRLSDGLCCRARFGRGSHGGPAFHAQASCCARRRKNRTGGCHASCRRGYLPTGECG